VTLRLIEHGEGMMRHGRRREQRNSYGGKAQGFLVMILSMTWKKQDYHECGRSGMRFCPPAVGGRTGALDGIARRWDHLPMRSEILREISGSRRSYGVWNPRERPNATGLRSPAQTQGDRSRSVGGWFNPSG
jgi:hypothetical protein